MASDISDSPFSPFFSCLATNVYRKKHIYKITAPKKNKSLTSNILFKHHFRQKLGQINQIFSSKPRLQPEFSYSDRFKYEVQTNTNNNSITKKVEKITSIHYQKNKKKQIQSYSTNTRA